MPDHADLNLRQADEGVEPVDARPNRPTGPVVVIALLVVAAGLAVYLVFGRQTSAPVDQQPAAPAAAAERHRTARRARRAGDRAAARRERPGRASTGAKLSSHPRVAAWLTTDGLVRNFTVVVANVSEGRSPATHLRTVAPSGQFRVVTQKGVQFVDARTYQRYDSLADAFASLDPAGSARLYATLKPRIEEAAGELGYPAGSFDRMLEKAIVSLLATPVPSEDLAVHPRGAVVYGYADEDLESLTGAQKHLLRMGPRNARL